MDDSGVTKGTFSAGNYDYTIALYYTGDDKKAKQMVAGEYNDLFVIKALFSSTTVNGAFILFFNYIQYKLVHTEQVVVAGSVLRKIDPMDDWMVFEKSIVDNLKNVGYDENVYRFTLRNKLRTAFTLSFSRELAVLFERNDDIVLNNMLRKILQDSLGLQRVQLSAEFQTISSLDMEQYSISSKKLDISALSSSGKKASPLGGSVSAGTALQQGKSGIKLILKCSLILSPIKGVHITQLSVGDRISISIVDRSTEAVKVAEAFNAYADGEFSPITARIKAIDYRSDVGYTIHAVIAKGILAEIIEEEENIKIAMDPSYLSAHLGRDDEKRNALPFIVMIVVAIIILIIVIITLIV